MIILFADEFIDNNHFYRFQLYTPYEDMVMIYVYMDHFELAATWLINAIEKMHACSV